MKHSILTVLFVWLFLPIFSQEFASGARKPFWSEDFSAGTFPSGWKTHALNDSSALWICTDQPFPGSYGRDQQAPPIASGSRGFHAQFPSGVRVDKYYRRWEKAGVWPDAWLQTPAIDCRGKNSVVLTFDQQFMWNDWGRLRADSGLFVCVSNDGKSWKEYDVRGGIGSESDCPNPMHTEINISAIAANQPEVYIRFHWRGIFSWYWMVDDIAVSEAPERDLAVASLISHSLSGNTFGKEEIFRFRVVNLGAKPVSETFSCFLQIDDRPVSEVSVPFDINSKLGIVDTAEVVFPPVDLTDYGIHRIRFYTNLAGDNRRSNDTLEMDLYSGAYHLGKVTKSLRPETNRFLFENNHAKVIVDVEREDIFRIRMSYNGDFTNPAGNDIVINTPKEKTEPGYKKSVDYHLIFTSLFALRVYENPMRFALYKPGNDTLVWEEIMPLSYGKETRQYLSRQADEYFYGGGMQNGRFSHRDKTILLRIDWNWEDGGAPNPAPFYMSTKGYGVLRNTYAPGKYTFRDTVVLEHAEPRLDAWYFAGSTLKNILNSYTDITGKPFLPPRWALGMGDANCYNRGDNKGKNTTGYAGTTPDVIPRIADKYIEYDMPRGWILPNDGYGCGYTSLDSVIRELGKRGFRTGLWTENGVEKIAREVGVYGSRLCKLDVAWIGEGYKFAIDGCRAAYDGIEQNSTARGFIWSVCGWAGTHRNSVVWTGDQKGTWDYIRWHIPTITGSGLTAQNCATGDIDGIFGGSAKTFTRDLQWKCFTPVLMSMSGWAPMDKQPFVHGEPYTSINRKYLKLKLRLTPYMYTLCHEASVTGVPAVRALVLEYPDDTVVRGTRTQYQFLLGPGLLVAPVYADTSIRDSIYLPRGQWYDFWNDSVVNGPAVLNGYPAPLEKLPLFVKAGSILPMYPAMNYDGERPADTITLDLYPGENGAFEMVEDEGSDRSYRNGELSRTQLRFNYSTEKKRITEISIGASMGNYHGKLPERAWLIRVHSTEMPAKVIINGKKSDKKNIFHSGPSEISLQTGYLSTAQTYKIDFQY